MSGTLEPHLLVKVRVEVSTLSEYESSLQTTEQFEFSCFRSHTGQSRLADIEDILAAFHSLEHRLQSLPLQEKRLKRLEV